MYKTYLSIGGKIIATIVLLGIVFLWTVVVFVVIPFAIALAMHGKKKKMSGFSLAIAMSPLVIVWTIIHRLWSRDKYNEYEKEFLRGFHEGQSQGHFEEGKRQGYTSVATMENLKPVAIYNIRKRGK